MRDKIQQYIKLWERRCYSDLPDEAPREINDLVPSYRRIAIAILKNDLSYIGIAPPQSEYYGILKCIELGKQYKKPNHMTQRELQETTFELINTLVNRQCYIKGYGEKFRVMDKDHHAITNITKQQFKILEHNDIVIRDGLIHVLNILANPFSAPISIKLPNKSPV